MRCILRCCVGGARAVPAPKICPPAPIAGASTPIVYTDVLQQESGFSSCLVYVALAADYATAKASCAAVGYHLLTTSSREANPVSVQLMGFVADKFLTNDSLSAVWMGAERVAAPAPRWSWIDGGSADNLNCSPGQQSGPCRSLWSWGQPDNRRGVESRMQYSRGGGVDVQPWVRSAFVCEREFACPAGSYCPANTDGVMPCGAGTFSAGGATECSRCVGNTVSDGVGATRCRVCDAGTEPDAAHSACVAAVLVPEGRVCPPVRIDGASAVAVYTDVLQLEDGASSCLAYVSVAADHATATASCASVGYHLLTTAATVRGGESDIPAGAPTLLSFTRTVVAAAAGAAAPWWMGAQRSTDVFSGTRGASWSWVDGTPADNLKCASPGCGGVWSPSQPDDMDGEDRLHFSPVAGGGGGLAPWRRLGYVCEREFVCPAGSFCALNSNRRSLCPAGTFSGVGATECSRCVGNSVSDGVGATSCRVCDPGTEPDAVHDTCLPLTR